MPQINDATPFLSHIETHNRHDAADFVTWHIGTRPVGLIRQDVVSALAAYPGVFRIARGRIDMIAGQTPAERTDILGDVTKSLSAAGRFSIRDEPYRIVEEWGQPAFAWIDRGASQFFGTRGFGVHMNGFVRRGGDISMWIARRAMDRAASPGKLDHIVAGGLPADLTAAETMVKEGREEAGMDEALVRRAVPSGFVSYAQEAPAGLRRDTLFVYDLELPPDFVPHNEDGEVECFTLMPIDEVARIVATTDDFKSNCNLVVMDFLVRHGVIGPDSIGYEALVHGLRQKLGLTSEGLGAA